MEEKELLERLSTLLTRARGAHAMLLGVLQDGVVDNLFKKNDHMKKEWNILNKSFQEYAHIITQLECIQYAYLQQSRNKIFQQ